MRKNFFLLVLAALLLPLLASAERVEVDGVYYNIDPETGCAEVEKGRWRFEEVGWQQMYIYYEEEMYSGDIFIPSSITYNGISYQVKSIGIAAFAKCKKLKSVTVPESITFIHGTAFQDCGAIIKVSVTNLSAFCNNKIVGLIVRSTKIVNERGVRLVDKEGNDINELHIPENVTSIGDSAFYNCYGITSVTIPNNVKSLGKLSFKSCSFTSITIPDNVTSIGDGAFSSCKKLTTVDVCSTGSFGKDVFSNSDIKEVTFDCDNVCRIFSGMSSLEKITFTDKVISIDKLAFSECIYVKSVVIPNSVKTIGEGAFYNCSHMSYLTIGESVNYIGYGAFGGTGIMYGDDSYVPFDTVICYAKEVPSTPDNSGLFSSVRINNNYSMSTLYVWESSLDAYKSSKQWNGFRAIKTIESLKKPETTQTYKLTYIIDGVEYKTYEIKKGNTITPEPEPAKEGYTFSGWSEIPSTMPGNDVTVTGTFTLNKYKLTYMIDGVEYKSYEVEYGTAITPETVTDREGFSFSGWDNLPETMPASDVVVTGSFTKGTYTLTYVLDGVTYKTYTYGYDESITPESVPDKEGYTFTGWDDLPSTMPGHDVTVTGSYTINKYKLIYMVDGEVYMTIEVEYGASITPEDEPTKDGYIFSGWSWIPSKMPAEDVTVSGTFKQVGYNINDNIYVIDGDYATLAKGNSTGDVVISPTIIINNNTYDVVTIGQYAFSNNIEITSVTIPDGITIIGDNAFEGCIGIRKLSMGKDIWKIGSKAFAYIGTSASARKRASSEPLVIECHAESVPNVQNDSFEEIDMENAILKVNDDLVDAYKNLYPWSQFTNIVGFNAPTGINSVYSEKNGDSIFSIDGRKIDNPKKGMNIIRTNQGTRKVMVK